MPIIFPLRSAAVCIGESLRTISCVASEPLTDIPPAPMIEIGSPRLYAAASEMIFDHPMSMLLEITDAVMTAPLGMTCIETSKPAS